MRALSLIAVSLIALSACGEREDAPTPVELVTAAPATSDAVAAAPAVLSAGDLRRVCRAGLAAVHGQTADAVQVDGVTGQVVTGSWRAPVDGGRMRAECRVERDLIVWKPLDRPDPAQNRWMNQSGDPTVRFALDGETITVTQTLPDGANEQSQMTVPVEQEAR